MSKGVNAVDEATNMKSVIAKASVSILMLPRVCTFLYMFMYIYIYIYICMYVCKYMYMHIRFSLFLLSSYIYFDWSLCHLPTGLGYPQYGR